MRKKLAVIMSLLMVCSMAACGQDAAENTTAAETETVSESTAPETEEATEEETEEETEPATTEEETDAEEETTKENTSGGEAGSADISDAVDASTTTDTEPVPLGQWAKAARYATEDETYHTVYVRVTDVTTATEDPDYIQSAVELHNSCSSDYSQIDLESVSLPDDVELCVMDYEVYVPAEFPGPDYGITEPNFSFSQSNVGGGGIPSADGTSTYIGLGTNTEDLALEKDPTYQPGNTYTFRSLFTMVKGYTDYVFEITSYPDGTKETSADVMYYAYFANK